MNVVVVLEHRFNRTPDGTVWTHTMFGYPFWTRYLAVFDQVRVVARVRDVPAVPPDWIAANGANVGFAAVPYYLGPWQYLRQAPQVRRAARKAIGPHDAVILRLSSQIADGIDPVLRRTNRPYGVEVVGDPYDVFAPGAIKHPLRPFFRWWFARRLRQQCAHACAAAYVTASALQRRYPGPAYSVGVSDVELSPTTFVSVPRPQRQTNSFTLISVGSLAQLYKAPDVLIDAVALCVSRGLDLRLVWVGDGKHRVELEARAAAHGLEQRICFLGQLSAGAAVRAQLDQADLFVLASRTEGLPRAMVEAMARAVPCIGSTVGGMPELLPAEDLVPPGDAAALAQKIADVLGDPQRMAQMSTRNLHTAQAYCDEVLRERRSAFYQSVRTQTEAWLQTQPLS